MSSSNKRERDLARQKYERQQERRAERESDRRRRNRIVGVVAGLVLVVLAVGALVLSSRSGSDTAASPSVSPAPSVSASASTAAVKGCTAAPTPTTKTQTWAKPGGSPMDATKTYTMTFQTNCGPIVIELDHKAPQTGQSMMFLADQGYYTDSDCFRLTTSGLFVFQCGSPTNNSQGGPGYQLPDENTPASGTTGYPVGTVAMANAGTGTAGSQFFIVYKNGSDFGPKPTYSIWGKVVTGLDILTRVAAAGTDNGSTDGKPAQPIVITKASTRATPRVG